MTSSSVELILLCLLAVSLPTARTAEETSIHIRENASAVPACLADCLNSCNTTCVCSRLDAVLNNLNEHILCSAVRIYVEYSHNISSVDVNLTTNKNISVFGIGYPTLTCVNGSDVLSIATSRLESVIFEFRDLGLDNCVENLIFSGLDSLTFSNCSFSNSSDILLVNIPTIFITECVFLDVDYISSVVSIIMNTSQSFINHHIQSSHFSRYHESSNNRSQGAISITYSDLNSTQLNTVIENCSFQQMDGKDGVSAISVSYNQAFNRTALEIIGCEFSNLQVITVYNLAKIDDHAAAAVLVDLSYTYMESFSFLLDGSKFFNNRIVSSNSSLVYINMRQVEFISVPQLVYTSNQFMNNTAYGLIARLYNSESTINQTIRDIVFARNYGKSIVIEFWCDTCLPSSNLRANVDLSNITVFHTRPNTIQYEDTLISLNTVNVKIADCTFKDNSGTSLYLYDSTCEFDGEVSFVNNAGRNGGAMWLSGDTTIRCSDNASLVFHQNYALFGGAMYVDTSYYGRCFIDESKCFKEMMFVDNNASTNGQTLFISQPQHSECFKNYYRKCFKNSTAPSIGTNAVNLHNSTGGISTDVTLFPGQRIPLHFMAKDYYNQSTNCIASALLRCGDETLRCGTPPNIVKLSGGSLVSLCNEPLISDLLVLYPLHSNTTVSRNIEILFKCEMTNQALLQVAISLCPLGLTFNKSSSICECEEPLAYNQDYVCSPRYGKACIKRGYWYGEVNVTAKNKTVAILAPCSYGKCNITAQGCPNGLNSNGQDFILLDGDPDNQCGNNRGGVLCTGCHSDSQPTFEGIRCVPKKYCKEWHPYLTLALAITFQLILAFAIVVAIRKNLVGESVYLYGPLFFICVLEKQPFDFTDSYSTLKFIVSIYGSIFLLNLELFGHIPLCFFEHVHMLENYSFHYLGPFIVAIVLLGTFALARFCPKILAKVQESPVQGICLLILLSSSSLANTTLAILTPTTLPGLEELRVGLQPELEYFDGIHIPFALMSLFVLLVMVLPFIFLLLFSPMLFSRFRFIQRIKPLLDEFQCCFKDKLRWYPGMYYCIGLLISAFSDYGIAAQTFLVIFATMQFLLQPYRKTWMNAFNLFLLCDLVLISMLLHEQKNPYFLFDKIDQGFIIAYVHILSLVPLGLISCGVFWIIYRSTNCKAHVKIYLKFKKIFKNSPKSRHLSDASVVIQRIARPTPTISSLNFADDEDFGNNDRYTRLDREPLLGLLDDRSVDQSDYSTLKQ